MQASVASCELCDLTDEDNIRSILKLINTLPGPKITKI